MKKSMDFIKENYKIIIPIGLMLVLFIAVFVFYRVSVSNKYRLDTEGEFYQYFYDKKYEYTGIVTTNKKEEIIEFKSVSLDVKFDSTPIYYKEENKVILPSDMSVVMPTLSCAEYLSLGYSYVEYKDGIYNLVTEKYNNRLNHYFFYDGGDLYFFIEEVNLKVNGEDIKLSPFSYVVAKRNNTLSYYDKENDIYRTFTLNDMDSKVSNDYYSIYVSRDMIDYQGSEVILTSGIDNLMTIDKKD